MTTIVSNYIKLDEDYYHEFSRRLANIRKERGLSQKDVAAQLGLTTSAYGHYENAGARINIIMLAKLAEILTVSKNYLMTGESDASHFDEGPALSITEKELLTGYRQLDERGKSNIHALTTQEYFYYLSEKNHKRG